MSVRIIVPYGGSHALRENAVHQVLEHLRAGPWPVSLFADQGDPHSRAQCCNKGAARTNEEILVFNDADLLCPHYQIGQAIREASAEPGLVFAFTDYVRLHHDGSRGVVLHEPPSNGCVAIRRSCFDQVGGYDDGYVGWALEDRDFNDRCAALWPHRRVEGEILHIWHGPRRADDTPLDCDPLLAKRNREHYRVTR